MRHDSIEFVVRVGEPGEILFFHDRGGEARLREDHHTGRGLNQMGAGSRADHEKERILNFSMQPDDAGETAEYLALAVLAPNRLWSGFLHSATLHMRVHARLPAVEAVDSAMRSSRRAARSFKTNCVALTK